MSTIIAANSAVSTTIVSSQAIALPTNGIQAGDLILIVAATRNDNHINSPSGYGSPLISAERTAISPGIRVRAWSRIADGSENGSTVTAALPGGSTSNSISVGYLILRGADTGAAILTAADNNSSNSVTAPSLSPSRAATLIYLGVATTAIPATPSGMDNQFSGQTTNGSQNHSHRVATQDVASGATGTRVGGLGSALSWVAVALAVLDAPGGGTPGVLTPLRGVWGGI